MAQDYDSGCGGSVATVQDDGRILIDGAYYSVAMPTWALSAFHGEAASPRDAAAWSPSVWNYSNQYGIPAALIAGMYAQESHFQENAMNYGDNPAGAGISQVTSSAAKAGHSDSEIAHNGDLAIMLGVDYFYKNCWVPHGGNPVKALASYNRGHVQCGAGKQGANRWNVVTYGDYVTPILKFSNGFIDSGLFDPANNPGNAPPPDNTPPPDYSGGGQDVVGATPSSSGVITAIALTVIAVGIGWLWETRHA